MRQDGGVLRSGMAAFSPLQEKQEKVEQMRYLQDLNANFAYGANPSALLRVSGQQEGAQVDGDETSGDLAEAGTSGSKHVLDSQGQQPHTIAKRFTEFVGKRNNPLKHQRWTEHPEGKAASINGVDDIEAWRETQVAAINDLKEAIFGADAGDVMHALTLVPRRELPLAGTFGKLGGGASVPVVWRGIEGAIGKLRLLSPLMPSSASSFSLPSGLAPEVKRYAEFLGKRSQGVADASLAAILGNGGMRKRLGQLLAHKF